MRLLLPATALALVTACGTPEPAAEAPAGDGCDLTVASLAGKTFVELEILPDGEKPNPQARVQFRDVGGTMHAMYTVKNGLHAYDYTCRASERPNEVACFTDPDFERACLALEAHAAGSCTPEALAKVGLEGAADKVAAGIKTAKERYDKAVKQKEEVLKSGGKDAAERAWKGFLVTNNNVANPVQGALYVKIDTKRCRIQLDDMFTTIYDGNRKEDFNPVGTNAFVRTDTTYLFEDCDSERLLADLAEAEAPKDLSKIPPVREFATGAPVHYHYLGDVETKPADGCTYAADLWVNWEKAQADVAIPADGAVAWHVEHSFPADTAMKYIGAEAGQPLRGAFVHLVRKKTCAGKTEDIDVVCTTTRLK